MFKNFGLIFVYKIKNLKLKIIYFFPTIPDSFPSHGIFIG
jgi:hypothetical protein